MAVTINNSDWINIETLIADVDRSVAEIELKWTLDILNHYAEVVSQAMGSVSAHGGYLRMSFLTASGKEEWKSLRPATLYAKAKRAGLTDKDLGPRANYQNYASEFRIWVDTGETKDAIDVNEAAHFAGIDSGQGEQFTRALRTEEGVPADNIPPRRLFAVANEMFIEAMQKAFANEDSPMTNYLRQEFIEKVLIGKHGWGKGHR